MTHEYEIKRIEGDWTRPWEVRRDGAPVAWFTSYEDAEQYVERKEEQEKQKPTTAEVVEALEYFQKQTWPKWLPRMQAAIEIGKAAEWRPIEEAPKDGTAIEAYCAESGFIRVVYWLPEVECWVLCGTADVWYSANHFTHYRPLPAGPEVRNV